MLNYELKEATLHICAVISGVKLIKPKFIYFFSNQQPYLLDNIEPKKNLPP